MKFDLKIGAVTSPNELQLVFREDFMKRILGVNYDAFGDCIEKKAKKVFSEFGRDFKNEFEIPRYDCLKAKDFNEAMKFTKNWYPSFVLQREIQNINAQTRLDFEDRG